MSTRQWQCFFVREGNRRSDVSMAMRHHRRLWYIHLQVQWVNNGDDRPVYSPLRVMESYSFAYTKDHYLYLHNMFVTKFFLHSLLLTLKTSAETLVFCFTKCRCCVGLGYLLVAFLASILLFADANL